MGSSSESNRLSNKNRLDLPTQRTLSEEEDTRSTHSYRSSRVSSRRQSTEESIDSEDEWYKYELRKLEELERQQMAAIESSGPPTTNTTYTYPYSQAHFPASLQHGVVATAPTVDMKERMNLVLQELVLKAAMKNSSDPIPLEKSDFSRERRLSFTKSSTRGLKREDSLGDEPLGYVSRRKSTSGHDDYEYPGASDQISPSSWNKPEEVQDFGSMIEPHPSGAALVKDMSAASSEYGGGTDSGLGTVRSLSSRDSSRATDDRPCVSLPSSSSLGEAQLKEDDIPEDKGEDQSSGATSGPGKLNKIQFIVCKLN
jgi:hypothetical protein